MMDGGYQHGQMRQGGHGGGDYWMQQHPYGGGQQQHYPPSRMPVAYPSQSQHQQQMMNGPYGSYGASAAPPSTRYQYPPAPGPTYPSAAGQFALPTQQPAESEVGAATSYSVVPPSGGDSQFDGDDSSDTQQAAAALASAEHEAHSRPPEGTLPSCVDFVAQLIYPPPTHRSLRRQPVHIPSPARLDRRRSGHSLCAFRQRHLRQGVRGQENFGLQGIW